jgi:hypothetical protein
MTTSPDLLAKITGVSLVKELFVCELRVEPRFAATRWSLYPRSLAVDSHPLSRKSFSPSLLLLDPSSRSISCLSNIYINGT